jgi:hypothetical protein
MKKVNEAALKTKEKQEHKLTITDAPPHRRQIRTTEDVLQEQKANAEKARAEARSPVGNTAVVRATDNALTADDTNPWIEVGAELDKYVGAPFLKFSKQGEFAINDVEIIPDGTRCIAHTDDTELGWQKWQDNRPVERRVGRIADKFIPPQRAELGDTDERQWELQDDGKRRDPWQFVMTVPITRMDTGETYLFTASSKGGLACVGKLVRAHGRRVQGEKVPGKPVVELKADFYKHRTYGRINVPAMPIVNWTGANGKPLSTADDLRDEIPF